MPFQKLLIDNRIRLTPSQRRIMQYIMDNYEEAIFLTASQLAQSVGVSEATVVRLAQALGFDGYPGMQKKFREGLQNRLSTVTRLEHTVDHVRQVGDVVVKVLQEDIQNLSETLRDLPIEVFEQAVAHLEKGKRIFVVGLRPDTGNVPPLSWKTGPTSGARARGVVGHSSRLKKNRFSCRY